MIPKKVATLIAILAVSTSALNGCGSAPRERYYVLSANDDVLRTKGDSPLTQKISMNIMIGTISIPEIVNRPQMVVLMPNSEVSVAEQSRWVEPLDGGIARVVADNLARLFPSSQVSPQAQSRALVADYRVLIDVQHFNSIVGEGVHDEFVWTVRATNKEGVAKSGRTVVREAAQGNEYAALVAAHNRALTTLSRDIATALQAMQ